MDHFLSCLHPNPGWSENQISDFPQEISLSDSYVIGKHCILELYECNKYKLNDEKFVNKAIKLAAKYAGATLLNLTTHKFEPQGLTSLALLAESHISIHTWPEMGYGAVDVFTCGDHAMPERACDVLIKELSAKRFSLQSLKRKAPVQFSHSSN
ncbi:adenosylmethionine decarboxylase [Prochlorococcus sp. MIT 1223]|uniref:adenosylmethionine decarboxylase n=1 Tax=Prochlorococcus sp. MIT 1223 TaxID=3096217 RepID=UPI002A760080|nr:adenosylmethionine decarboxylase [Prochlorococcus sp. MIT 1223]